ncbi:hypothetical protein SPRG_11589 [Saprolegnia parasitica CBS 223.65]|uniref:Uncharacterized protein n=1 Tax=Saprolegnia parasitica (strain CBS 223.65) TaxID=695850 RepID=A0A067C137_SAPPC|nr:hypothetical protein SPRG_11589 [Saprolegnia parasitica CBS 223.65]KDO22830.1 hypothetical protein SPRG_11589 [Saprolegnia parasitica CBS 223.65]|eukprot:XP_012206501.1 hypothetical protein SPRG_11589 [Saprolegnia parasitica CBS 223.65]
MSMDRPSYIYVANLGECDGRALRQIAITSSTQFFTSAKVIATPIVFHVTTTPELLLQTALDYLRAAGTTLFGSDGNMYYASTTTDAHVRAMILAMDKSFSRMPLHRTGPALSTLTVRHGAETYCVPLPRSYAACLAELPCAPTKLGYVHDGVLCTLFSEGSYEAFLQRNIDEVTME